jgi:hypothetical protein
MLRLHSLNKGASSINMNEYKKNENHFLFMSVTPKFEFYNNPSCFINHFMCVFKLYICIIMYNVGLGG